MERSGHYEDQKPEGKFSFSKEEIEEIQNNPDHKPEELIALLEKDFGSELDEGVGVWEGYTLREHTLMVMKQYRRYFYDRQMPNGVDRNFLELILAFHDIGKPRAVKEGDKHRQHEHTGEILKNVLYSLGYGEKQVQLAEALIDGDPVGKFLKTGETEKSKEKILEMAGKSGMNLEDFWQLLLIYFRSDAGAYTVDAGGKPSLDRLFVFNHSDRKLTFSPLVQSAIDELRSKVFEK